MKHGYDSWMHTLSNGITTLQQAHCGLLDVCDELEQLADRLPQLDRLACTAVARRLSSIVRQTQKMEETILFPLLEAHAGLDLRHFADRLRQENVSDFDAAEEISEALSGREGATAEALGYQLRSFFEIVRRHVHFEQDLLVLVNNWSPTHVVH